MVLAVLTDLNLSLSSVTKLYNLLIATNFAVLQ